MLLGRNRCREDYIMGKEIKREIKEYREDLRILRKELREHRLRVLRGCVRRRIRRLFE